LTAHASAGGQTTRRAARPAVRRAPASVRAIAGLLEDRLLDPPALAELAAMTGLSQFALLRAFRAETGLPPHAYLNHLRGRRAGAEYGNRGGVGGGGTWLGEGVRPAEVAFETGFADQAHLTRHFKRVVGVPPGAYQRERLLAA